MNKTFYRFKNRFISGTNWFKNRFISVTTNTGISYIIPYKLNRMLNINLYNFRNFSATNEKNKYSWLLSSLESESYDILPCVNGRTKTKFNKSLKDSLCCIISTNNKSILYKLEYFLYLYTNDENKELIRGVPIYDSVLDNKYSNQVMRHIFPLSFLENQYEYKGYYLAHVDLYNPELVLDLTDYIQNVYDTLGKYVVYINESLDIQEFIEFKKSTLLLITRIDKNTSKSNDTSRSNDSVLIKHLEASKFNTVQISKCFYSTSTPRLRRKLIVNSTSPQKLVVNSSIFKITFADNQSILLLSNILRSLDIERVKQVKQIELVIKILNCNAYAFYDQNLDKPFLSELKNVLSLLSLLKDNYYTFDFYFYIVSRKKALFELFSYNFNNTRFDTGSSFVKINAGFGYLKLTSIRFKMCKNWELQFHYIIKHLGRFFLENNATNFNIILDKQFILVINKLEDNDLNQKQDSVENKITGDIRGFKGNNRKFSTYTCNRNNNLKPTIEKLKPKSLGVRLEETVINGLVFQKSKNTLWINYTTQATEIEFKKTYESIQAILLEIQRIDSKGFLNTIDLNHFPIISRFVKYFTNDATYIQGDKSADAYKWIFNVLMMCLYELTVKIIFNMEQNLEVDSDLMADFKVLSQSIFGKIDPSVRIKLQKRGISIIQNIYTGFDTEYKNRDAKYNDLISVQLAVNSKSLLKLPKYSEYKLSSLDTLTGKEYKLKLNLNYNEKEGKGFNYFLVEDSLNKSINEIRFLRFKKNDASISILIEGLTRLKIPYIEKDNVFIFSFPRNPIQPYIYYNKGKGYSFEDMLNQSNLIGVPRLNEEYSRIIELLKGISKNVELHFDWKEEGKEILDIIKVKNTPKDLNFEVKKMTRSNMTVFTSDKVSDKVSVTKIRNNYFIAHLTNADLSMMSDFETFKEKLDIVNKSFVTLGKPIVVQNTNVIIRDTMLLAPAGNKSLEDIGVLYGQTYEKVKLTDEQKQNMDLLLKNNKSLFDSYASKDAIIPLIHANFMEDFNFNTCKEIGIPITLSNLGSNWIKESWRVRGYEGYQIAPKYLLGDTSATQTPKGLFSISNTGLWLSYYIGNYKGGRNESFMYGVDNDTMWWDYDLTSAYTTAMAGLGNPDYKKGHLLSVKQLEKMSFKDILYSYIIIKTSFKFKQNTKFPSIPCFIDETTTVYPLKGEGILTGAEYLLAKSQGCELKISEIYCIPFEIDKDEDESFINLPFEDEVKEIQRLRRDHPKGTIENLTYKEIGNSIYGAIVRGMSDKRKFDIKSGRMLRMEGSFLSNPVLASWITGFIRAIIGECLENMCKLNGKIVSATTDGFITDIENLEWKLTDKKFSLIKSLKVYIYNLELLTSQMKSLIRDEEELMGHFNILLIAYSKPQLRDEFYALLKNFIKDSNITDFIEFINLFISEMNWTENDSLLNEFKNLRYILSGKNQGLEIKKSGKGLISWTTRGQLGKESKIKATTGFQAKNYTLQELHDLFKEVLKTEDKSLEFNQFSLRSALDIYKEGGHVTPLYENRTFRLKYDNRRLIIVPKELENTFDFSNVLLDSKPVPDKDFCKTLRSLSKLHKQRIYNKFTSISSDSKYKNYSDLAIRNFIKALLSNPPKYNLKFDSDGGLSSYSEILDFIKAFDNKAKISKYSISKLKNRKMIFKTVPRTKETLKFVEHVKSKYRYFNDDEFFIRKEEED